MERHKDEHASAPREVRLHTPGGRAGDAQPLAGIWSHLGWHQRLDAWLFDSVSLARVNDISC